MRLYDCSVAVTRSMTMIVQSDFSKLSFGKKALVELED
jgi:hypothetical protein